jgi:ABC-type lipoprotein release transport system permease subunit
MALGLTPGRLGRLVILETAIMGVMGIVLGAIAGGILTSWFSVHGLSIPGMEEMAAAFNLPPRMYPRVTIYTLFLGPIVVFLFTLLAALYPALRLHRLHPVAAMRAA